MGYFVSAHLMQHHPDSAGLSSALPSSVGFRAYRHANLPLFAIDTFRAAKPSRYPFSVATPATDIPLEFPQKLSGLQAIYQQLHERGNANGLKRAYINLSTLLASSLHQDVFTLYSDDDGNDFACFGNQDGISTLVARCGEFVVRFDAEGDATLNQVSEDNELHALASGLLLKSFGISGKEIGLGSFDPPENFGFVELPHA